MGAKSITVTAPATSSCTYYDITEILVRVGEQVKVDQPIVRLDTEKAYLDYTSSYSGRVVQILVNIGDRVEWNSPLMVIELSDENDETCVNSSPMTRI